MTMQATRCAVFTEAIKVPLRDHDAFPDIACSGDKNLQVEAFLKAHGRIGKFLEDPLTEASIE